MRPFLFTRPQGVLPAIGVVLSAVCGSVISDINADRSWARKQADVWICISAAGFAGAVNRFLGAAFLVTAVLLFDACAGLGLCHYVESRAGRV